MKCSAKTKTGNPCRHDAAEGRKVCGIHSMSIIRRPSKPHHDSAPTNGNGILHCELCCLPYQDHTVTGGCPAHQTTLLPSVWYSGEDPATS